jgi:subtilisin
MLGIPYLHEYTKGKGLGVLIIDSGIDRHHEDIAPNVKMAASAIGGIIHSLDLAGHGTLVAGIIGAIDNDRGIIGIAPESDLYSIKVLDRRLMGSVYNVAWGLYWACLLALQTNIRVVSISLGAEEPLPQLVPYLRWLVWHNVVPIAAVGNWGTVDFPAAYSLRGLCIAVTSISKEEEISAFSATGEEVTVSAPGENIISCYPGNRYRMVSGTSFAAPAITAIAALILARHEEKKRRGFEIKTPCENLSDVVGHLQRGSKYLGINERHNVFGWGMPVGEKLAEIIK